LEFYHAHIFPTHFSLPFFSIDINPYLNSALFLRISFFDVFNIERVNTQRDISIKNISFLIIKSQEKFIQVLSIKNYFSLFFYTKFTFRFYFFHFSLAMWTFWSEHNVSWMVWESKYFWAKKFHSLLLHLLLFQRLAKIFIWDAEVVTFREVVIDFHDVEEERRQSDNWQ
jgi:hypothetical protein